MKFCYDIFPGKGLIVARYTGYFTLAELMNSSRALWADPRYSRSFVGIVDLADPSLGVSLSDFKPLVEFLRQQEQTSEARWAAVTSTPFATACSLIYKRSIAERHVFEIFSTWDAACHFVGVEVAPDVPLVCGMAA